MLKGKNLPDHYKRFKTPRNKILHGQTINNSNRVAIFCLHANVKTEEEARVRWLFKHRNYSKIRNTSCTNKFWTLQSTLMVFHLPTRYFYFWVIKLNNSPCSARILVKHEIAHLALFTHFAARHAISCEIFWDPLTKYQVAT